MNKGNCCCEKGDRGEQGVQGIQGIPGVNGHDGQQGVQGIQGVKGDTGVCDCSQCIAPNEFAEVYSAVPQNLLPSPSNLMPGQFVLFENLIYATSNIDVSQAASLGKIIFNLPGWYDIATGICGYLNSIASPLPCWTLSLFKNGIYVPGSTFANQTISPEQKSNEIVADVFVHFDKGDYIQLANTSNALVNMAAPTLGTNAPASSSYLKAQLLKAD